MESSYVKKERSYRYVVYIVLFAVAAGIAFYFYSPAPVNNAANDNMTLFLENKISDIDQNLAKGNEDKDIARRLTWHKSNTALYNETKKSTDKKIEDQRAVLKTKIIKIQEREFPELRSAYVDSKKDILAQENIQISVSGKKNDILTFSGPIFEPKHTQKSFMKNMQDIINDLRFKEVVYKWSGNATDLADYKIDSKTDVEI